VAVPSQIYYELAVPAASFALVLQGSNEEKHAFAYHYLFENNTNIPVQKQKRSGQDRHTDKSNTPAMPGSKKMERNAQQRANREAGIGDAQGRIVREKNQKMKLNCSICSLELVVTKTNTELIQHADAKHSKTLEECFKGATEESEKLKAALGGKKGDKGGASAKSGSGLSKKDQKAKAEADFLASLGGGATKKKKKKKAVAKKPAVKTAVAVDEATKKVAAASIN
jgi:hypothetical protein